MGYEQTIRYTDNKMKITFIVVSVILSSSVIVLIIVAIMHRKKQKKEGILELGDTEIDPLVLENPGKLVDSFGEQY